MNYHTRILLRALCAIAAAICYLLPVIFPNGWEMVWWVIPGAMFATAAVLLREDEGDRACREHAEWHYGERR